ncbi:MAG: hypothetical protein GC200_01635 [Tepidisphaera sp.]|nr:hypothetical protein [Tepidisphaera sp.]
MIEPSSDRARRLAGLSQRLRMMHAQLADQPADMRTEQLRDAVQREISILAPQERDGFLMELMEQFPVWNAGGAPATPAPARAAAISTDPRALAEKLVEACKGLSEGERGAIIARLGEAGLAPKPAPQTKPTYVGEPIAAPPAAAAAPVSASAAAGELRKAIGVMPEVPLDQGRVLEMAAILAEFTLRLEPWACTYWKDIAPDAKSTVFQTLNKDLAKYATGDEKVTKAQLANNVYNLRSLVSLLMKGVVEAGKQFARDHLQRFSVEEIKRAAGPGSLVTSEDVKCWRQYVKLMEGYDAAAVEKRLKQLLAKDVDAGLGQVIRK